MNETNEQRPTPKEQPAQTLPYPASEADMQLKPDSDLSNYRPANKLAGKTAIITGGDSGIGRAVAIAFAMEGADVAIVYLDDMEDEDAEETRRRVEEQGRRCLTLKRDISHADQCRKVVEDTVRVFGKINILVNNAAYSKAVEKFEDLDEAELRRTFDTNILSFFLLTKYALPHMSAGDAIINTGSTTGIYGNPSTPDYAATNAAVHNFTKSLAIMLAERNIRVNCVVPGPIWTPIIPASGNLEKVSTHGSQSALGRAGQPEELAPAYVYFASSESSFTTGGLLEIHGGFTKIG